PLHFFSSTTHLRPLIVSGPAWENWATARTGSPPGGRSRRRLGHCRTRRGPRRERQSTIIRPDLFLNLEHRETAAAGHHHSSSAMGEALHRIKPALGNASGP